MPNGEYQFVNHALEIYRVTYNGTRPRTRVEKRAAVESMLKDTFRYWSDGLIAQSLKVSRILVGKIRWELEGIGIPQPTERIFIRGGRISVMNTENIGRSAYDRRRVFSPSW